MNRFNNLLSPIRIGDIRFKNRIFSAPTQMRQKDSLGHINDYGIEYYEAKAAGGAAQVTIGDTPVDPLYGATQYNSFRIDSPGCLTALSEVAAAIKQYGAVASIELSHGGNISSPSFNGDREPIGPVDRVLSSGTHVRAMDKELMDYVLGCYADAAQTAQTAGFDMCMIHCGHGWLLSQFLSPATNTRTDEYGGSLENRARFLFEVIDAVRARCGKRFLIELRISGDEYIENGFHINDMVEFSRMAESRVDLIHVSAGVHGVPSGLVRMFPSNLAPHGCNVYLAAAVKKAVKIPVVTVGGISSPELAEKIISEGDADIVAMGRALIADPELPKKALYGRDGEIRPCMRCLSCLAGMNANRHFACAVNPTVGHEHRTRRFPPTAEKKNVLVIGGGPAGMSAAITAAERGHKVTLCEKSDVLGGLMRHSDIDPLKADLKAFKDYLIRRINASDVEVLLGTEADAGLMGRFEAVIAAVGSLPVAPRIEGTDSPNVMSAMAAHEDNAKIGGSVVIIGGGLVGCETALFLAEQGRKATVIEMAGMLAAEDPALHRLALLEKLKEHNVESAVLHTCLKITQEGVWAENSSGVKILFPADTIVYSIGMRANEDSLRAIEKAHPVVFAVGDCVRARKINSAVTEGYFTAINL